MNCNVVVIKGDQKGLSIALTENKKITIGKDENNVLQLTDQGISRKHCCIWEEGGTVWVEDLGSSNGTFTKDGEITGKKKLTEDNFVMVGLATLQVKKKAATNLIEKTNIRTLHRKEKQDPTFSLDYLEATQMKQDLTFLHVMGKLAHAQLDIPQLVCFFLENLIKMLEITQGCIILKIPSLDQNNPTVFYRVQQKDQSFSNKPFSPNIHVVDNAIVKSEGSLVSETIGEEKRINILCVPLEGYRNTLGAIYLESISQDEKFQKKSLDLLTAVSRQLSFAIERTLLEKLLVSSGQDSIIEHSRDVIYRHKKNFHFVIISPSILSITGFSHNEILKDGMIWKNCIYEKDKDIFYKKLEKVFAGQEHTAEFRIQRKDGQIVWVEETSYPIIDKNNNFICIQGLIKNITEKKLLQEQLARSQRMEAFGILAGGVAHDLNNILGGLVSYPDILLLSIPQDSHLREYLHGIKNSALLAANVVKDLLTLGKEEQYTLIFSNLNECLYRYLQNIEIKNLKNKHPNIKWSVKLSQDPLFVMSSTPHLSLVFLNLILNAIQAMSSKGTIVIVTDWKYLDKESLGYDKMREGEYATVQVSDTGEGIGEEDLKKIFEPFYSKKIQKGGTGFGLAVVYRVIKNHFGYVNVKSKKGEGTSFTIYLPLHRQKPQNDIEKNVLIEGGNETILLIDDIPLQREFGCELLVKLGYKVVAAASGAEAIEHLTRNKVDLIILDMVLEKMDGLEIYKKIIEIHPYQKAIIVSGFADRQKIKATQELGAGSYIKKPYTIETISKAIRKELEKK